MPISLDEIVEETRNWPPDVVAELVDRILLARHGGVEPKVQDAWQRETRRRITEIESGAVKGISGEEVSARVRNIVGK